MRKAQTIAPGRVRLIEADVPRVGVGEVLIEVEAAGVCGSDGHIFHGRHPHGTLPVVQGHEIVGRIVDAGSESIGEIGQRVVIDPVIACGECAACRRGRPNACERIEVIGVHRDGGFADYLSVPAEQVHQVGDLETELAVLVEPFAVGLHAINRAGVGRGHRVVVLGAGSIGRAAVAAAADRGCEVIVAGRDDVRLRGARALGASHTVRSDRESLEDAIRQHFGADGADVVVEATGVSTVFENALGLVAPTGTVVAVGVSLSSVSLPLADITRKEISILGARNSAGEFPAAIDLLRRSRDLVADLVTVGFSLDETAQALAAAGGPAVTKAIVLPGSAA